MKYRKTCMQGKSDMWTQPLAKKEMPFSCAVCARCDCDCDCGLSDNGDVMRAVADTSECYSTMLQCPCLARSCSYFLTSGDDLVDCSRASRDREAHPVTHCGVAWLLQLPAQCRTELQCRAGRTSGPHYDESK